MCLLVLLEMIRSSFVFFCAILNHSHSQPRSQFTSSFHPSLAPGSGKKRNPGNKVVSQPGHRNSADSIFDQILVKRHRLILCTFCTLILQIINIVRVNSVQRHYLRETKNILRYLELEICNLVND